MIGTHRTRALLWIPQYVFDIGNVAFRDTDEPNPFTKPIETKKIIFILDPYLRSRLVPPSDIEKDKRIGYYFYNAETIATFVNKRSDDYPVMTMDGCQLSVGGGR